MNHIPARLGIARVSLIQADLVLVSNCGRQPRQMPANRSALMRQYNWQRFWLPQTEVLDLSDAGFLRDPGDGLFRTSSLVTLAEMERWSAAALVGEPGIGKSTALETEASRVAALPASDDTLSIYGRPKGLF